MDARASDPDARDGLAYLVVKADPIRGKVLVFEVFVTLAHALVGTAAVHFLGGIGTRLLADRETFQLRLVMVPDVFGNPCLLRGIAIEEPQAIDDLRSGLPGE